MQPVPFLPSTLRRMMGSHKNSMREAHLEVDDTRGFTIWYNSFIHKRVIHVKI